MSHLGRQTLVLSLLAAAVLGGCGSISTTGAGAGEGRSPASGVRGDWVLVSGTGAQGALSLVPGHGVTLTVAGGRISGRAACNSYGGEVSLTAGGGFALSDGLSGTEMACVDQRANELEAAYLAALRTVKSADVAGGRLVLRGGSAELTFARPTPVPDAPVEGTTWTLNTIIQGPVAATTRQDQPAPTLRLEAGRLTASTGCRSLSGDYSLAGSRLTVTTLIRGKATCPDAVPGVPVDQDSVIAKTLTAGADLAVEGNQLTLTAGPELELRYQAQTAS